MLIKVGDIFKVWEVKLELDYFCKSGTIRHLPNVTARWMSSKNIHPHLVLQNCDFQGVTFWICSLSVNDLLSAAEKYFYFYSSELSTCSFLCPSFMFSYRIRLLGLLSKFGILFTFSFTLVVSQRILFVHIPPDSGTMPHTTDHLLIWKRIKYDVTFPQLVTTSPLL